MDINLIKFIHIVGEPRYLEDAYFNNEVDEEGRNPLLKNGLLDFTIDLENGAILNWKKGNVLQTHYKVCDQCNYLLLDKNHDCLINLNENNFWYVPEFLDFTKDSYGDYLILDIDENGKIIDFNLNKMKDEIQIFIDEMMSKRNK